MMATTKALKLPDEQFLRLCEMKIIIVATNSQGWQLRNNGMFWSIVKPDIEFNKVPHVGQKDYVRKIWQKNFAGK